MHSPVWQDHPSHDTTEYWSDWDYYSDDYYDQGTPPKKRQRIDGEGDSGVKDEDIKRTQAGKKRRKLRPTQDVPELSLGESLNSDIEPSALATPTVVWRSKEAHDPIENHIVTEGEGEKVALLKDWRERFKAASKLERNSPPTKDPKPRKPNQTAIAVVIGRRPSENSSVGIDAPPMSSKAKNIASRSKAAPGRANRAPTSNLSAAKPKAAITSTTKGVRPPATAKRPLHGTVVLGQRANRTEILGQKGKASETEGVTTDGDETVPRKRRAPNTKEKENDVGHPTDTKDATTAGRKRKAADADEENTGPPAVKRKAPVPKTTVGASEARKESTVPTRRNTRSKRE